SSGNYGIEWEGMSEENKEANRETIAGELIHMREQMEIVKQQDQIRIWTTEGLSKFGEIIRNNQNNFDKLSESLISNVVNYLDAKVGGLFILEEDEKDNKPYLLLRASYAYERKKFITKRIEIGEGMIGQCYLEGHTIHMAKVPNNFLAITSGLGGANPNSILVIPLRTNEKIEGVLELASLKPFKPHEIEFLEKLGELLASSIINVKTGEKTAQLLAVSREQTEEMRAQEEEMRQNMEELEATQEQMNRTVGELAAIKSTLEKEKYLLDSLMDNIPDAIYFKDRQSKFIRLSKYLADNFHRKVDELIGKSDFDFQDHAHAQEAFEDEKNIMATQKPKIDYVEKEVLTDGSEHWVSTTKMPLINARGEVVGTFGISRDVTKLKKLEIEVLNKDKSLVEEKKHYEEKIKSLEKRLKIYEERIEE
ncbi:MAG TPA: GAF domain-containing protein, partial [Chryseolinea sp.]|nr:GAF domain-containing protein [Chryseolinea sp.]